MTKVHLIGNAHLDPVWLWRWTEGCSEVMATFRSALDRMNEYPDYIFTCAGAHYYEWVERLNPDMFREIQQRVKEGRWVIVGGWRIQPDCNAPSAESFARQALYSQRYYREKFATQSTVGYNVDSFGHSAMLPQLLKLSGLNAYVYMRPSIEIEKEYPFPQRAFIWEGADGTKIPTFRLPEPYCSSPFEAVAEKAQADCALAEQTGQPLMSFYGVGNHGGGPTKRNLNALNQLMSESAPGEYAYSSPNAYFEELDKDALPHLKDELFHHASGCYSSLSQIKRLNRMAENRLASAEKYLCMARLLGYPMDFSPIAPTWKQVCFNQFHDIMGGCCIRAAYEDAVRALGGCIMAADEAANQALQTIAWNISTSDQPAPSKSEGRLWTHESLGTPLTLFNPEAQEMVVPVRCGVHASKITDEQGNLIPFQNTRSQVTNGEHDKWESVFIARIPAMGWRTYRLFRTPAEQPAAVDGMLEYGEDWLENDLLRAEFDRQSGLLTRLYDKKSGQELLASPMRLPVMDETDSDTWAHRIFRFDKECGAFEVLSTEAPEIGELFVTRRCKLQYSQSEAELNFTMYRGLPALYVDVKLYWRETHRMLKLSLPTPFAGQGEIASIPGGFYHRKEDGKEQPMQNWVALGALGVATDALSAYDSHDGQINLTLVRSPLFADHYGVRDERCEPTEQGEHRISLALCADTDPACLSALSSRLLCPPDRILGSFHQGKLPESFSGMQAPQSLVLDALKPAEEGEGYVVHLRNVSEQPLQGAVEWPLLKDKLPLDMHGQQILSLRLHNGKWTQTDFTEA